MESNGDDSLITAQFRSRVLYVLVVDCNPSDWFSQSSSSSGVTANAESNVPLQRSRPSNLITFGSAWRALIDFCVTLAFGWSEFALAVICAHSSDSQLMFLGSLEEFAHQNLLPRVLDFMIAAVHYEAKFGGSHGDCLLAAALSKALCVINSEKDDAVLFRSRILVLDVSPTNCYSSQNTALMNVAFAAAQMKVSIDVCSLRLELPSTICQQLAEVTGGLGLPFNEIFKFSTGPPSAPGVGAQTNERIPSYYTPEAQEEAFLGFLTFHFLPLVSMGPQSSSLKDVARNEGYADGGMGNRLKATEDEEGASTSGTKLTIAKPSVVLNDAICLCHMQSVSVANVCSACLAVYCLEFNASSCLVCNTMFTEATDLTVADAAMKGVSRRRLKGEV